MRRYASHDTNTKDYKRMRKHFAHKRGMELHMAEACLHALKLESGLSRADPQVTASRKNSASKNMHHRMLQRGIHGARRPPSWPITVLGRSSCAARSAALTSASCTSSCGRGAAGGGGGVSRGPSNPSLSLQSLVGQGGSRHVSGKISPAPPEAASHWLRFRAPHPGRRSLRVARWGVVWARMVGTWSGGRRVAGGAEAREGTASGLLLRHRGGARV